MRGLQVSIDSDFVPEESAGVFVGVRAFDQGFSEIPYAVDDAIDLAFLFANTLQLIPPKRICLVLSGEPQKDSTRQYYDWLVKEGARKEKAGFIEIHGTIDDQSLKTGPNGLLVVTLATHGFMESNEETSCFAAHNTLSKKAIATSVKQNELIKSLRESNSPRRLLLLDTCREILPSSRNLETPPVIAPSLAKAISQTAGLGVIAASSPGGRAYDDLVRRNGVFTAAVIDGLLGQAKADATRRITVSALAEFVHDRVQTWITEHKPPGWRLGAPVSSEVSGAVGLMPLVDVDLLRRRHYFDRRVAALATLRANQKDALAATDVEFAADLLKVEEPTQNEYALLEEIEVLDGTERMRRNLKQYLEGLRKDTLKSTGRNEIDQFDKALRLQFGYDGVVDWSAARACLEQGTAAGSQLMRVWTALSKSTGRIGFPRIDDAEKMVTGDDLRRLEERAEEGIWQAAFLLDYLYSDGLGLKRNYEKSFRFAALAARSGEASTQAALGWHYEHGLGVEKDLRKAVPLYAEAARQGHTLAMTNLAEIYRLGKTGEPDFGQAVKLYSEAVGKGSPVAMYELGFMYLKGQGVKEDLEAGLTWIRRAADLDHADAQIYLAAYAADHKMNEAAINWVSTAANLGSPAAINLMGSFYLEGIGVRADAAEAARLFKMAAKGNQVGAMHNLYELYSKGAKDFPANPALAQIWLLRAAEAGHRDSRKTLGLPDSTFE